MTIHAVVWDIGNVLINWDPEGYYDRRIGIHQRKRLMSEVDLHGVNLTVDRGADLSDAINDLARAHPDWSEEILWWKDEWLNMASPAIDHSVRLLRALRAKDFPVFALSNFGIQTFEIARAAYPFLDEFDAKWISGHMEVIKPEAAIYEKLEAESGVNPHYLLFTDDRVENIEAAQARGWKTHLFDGSAAWAQTLVEHGLLSEKEAR